MAMPLIYAPAEPGQIIVRGYGPISVWSWDDGFLYDEASLTTTSGGALSAGTDLVFFRDVASKNKKQTNMTLTSQLPSGWEVIVLKIGIYIPGSTNEALWKAIVEYGYVEFVLNNTARLASGPVSRFPLGGGLFGHVDVSDVDSAAELSFMNYNVGTPIATAVPPLSIPIVITDKMTLQGTLHFYDTISTIGGLSIPATTTVSIQMVLQGFVKMPAM